MTIERTRELLGKEVDGLTDDQILQEIQAASLLCDDFLKLIRKDILHARNPSVKNEVIL